MYIEDLDKVAALRNHLKQFEGLKRAAESGSIGDFEMWYRGEKFNAWGIISADPIREAMIAECDREIARVKSELGNLGVNTAPKLTKAA